MSSAPEAGPQDDANAPQKQPEQPSIPVEEDLMQLARLGQIGAIQKLFDSGKSSAKDKDEQGITALHWAAIKGHYALCHFLLQAGAQVDARGGDILATPVLWAARSCHYHIVNLLLQHGADPLLPDGQGFNLLQNATMEGNVFQLLLILQHEVPIDVTDSHGHTSLMWAAYKGFPAEVELLLERGANVNAVDENGFTALHWSLVKGSFPCVSKLIEYGSDRFATTNDGKTPATVAKEMNSVSTWRRALSDAGLYHNASPKPPLPVLSLARDTKLTLWRFFFFWPFLILILAFNAVAAFPTPFGILVAVAIFFALHWLANQILARTKPQNMKAMHHTPFLAGIFAGSLFWTGIQWVRKILPHTWFQMPFLNLLFAALFSLCTYFYILTMVEDPGYVPKITSRTEQKEVAQEMLHQGVFDERHFCIACMARRPLRSKHCRRCQRCVAKQDHHCPWVDNCVANNNHRHFLYYTISMWTGVLLLIFITYNYILLLPPSPVTDNCAVFGEDVCDYLNRDYFTIVLIVWIGLQITWVTLLLVSQLFQISRAQTTLEVMKGHPHHGGAGEVAAAAVTAGATSLEGAGLTQDGTGPDPAAAAMPPPRPPRQSWFEQWKRILGIDTFIATAIHGSQADQVLRAQRENPFNRGCFTNLADFFCDAAPHFRRRHNGAAMLGGLAVDYTTMYDVPSRSAVRKAPDSQGQPQGDYQAVGADDNV